MEPIYLILVGLLFDEQMGDGFIELNVRGTIITARKSSLANYGGFQNKLTSIFTPSPLLYTDHSGLFYIDCYPGVFQQILDNLSGDGILRKCSDNFPDVIELNVGGQIIATSLTTLTKDPDSMLATMFSGRHVVPKDKDGRYFIDCDGALFQHVLNFLRLGTLPNESVSNGVDDIAEYFGIGGLIKQLKLYHKVQFNNLFTHIRLGAGAGYESFKDELLQECSKYHHNENKLMVFHVSPRKIKTDIWTERRVGFSLSSPSSGCKSQITFSMIVMCVSTCYSINGMLNCLGFDLEMLRYGKHVYLKKGLIPNQKEVTSKANTSEMFCDYCGKVWSCEMLLSGEALDLDGRYWCRPCAS